VAKNTVFGNLSDETRQNALFVAIVILAAVAFWGPVTRLAAYALHHDSCSQVLVVPFISFYLLYMERKRIFEATRYCPSVGITVMVVGLAVGLWATRGLDRTAANGWLSVFALSIVLLWIGGFIACYGLVAAASAAFPLLFLILMIPPPDALLSRTVHLLQEGSTDVSFLLFRAVGLPVFRSSARDSFWPSPVCASRLRKNAAASDRASRCSSRAFLPVTCFFEPDGKLPC
jgi:hypothetical protein